MSSHIGQNTNPMNEAAEEIARIREQQAQRHSRIRMAKQLLRPLPRRANIHRWPVLKWFAKSARKRPYLWTFRQREVSLSIYLGSVIAFLPIMGFQFGIGFAIAVLMRVNLPTILGVQMVTNVFTAPAVYAFTAWVGHSLIDFIRQKEHSLNAVNLATDWVVGGIVVGLTFAFILDLVYRLVFVRRLSRPVNVKKMLKQ